jgi:Holliday junction resolvase RusA-like endonuclease
MSAPIILPWPVVASDNARHGVIKGRIRLTAAYRERKAAATLLARRAWRGEALTTAVRLSVTVHEPDRRRRDIGNLVKATADVLTGIAYLDDSQIDHLDVRRGAIDRKDPRLEITVSPLTETTHG